MKTNDKVMQYIFKMAIDWNAIKNKTEDRFEKVFAACIIGKVDEVLAKYLEYKHGDVTKEDLQKCIKVNIADIKYAKHMIDSDSVEKLDDKIYMESVNQLSELKSLIFPNNVSMPKQIEMILSMRKEEV